MSLGLSLADLNQITVGLVLEMIAEKSGEYEQEATQSDFDNF
jgi:hypothetical protein